MVEIQNCSSFLLSFCMVATTKKVGANVAYFYESNHIRADASVVSFGTKVFWGQAWASPTSIMTTALAHGIMLSIYLSIHPSMYHLPRVCRTLIPEIYVRHEIHVHPEMLRVFQYYWCAHMHLQLHSIVLNNKDIWSYSCPPSSLRDR